MVVGYDRYAENVRNVAERTSYDKTQNSLGEVTDQSLSLSYPLLRGSPCNATLDHLAGGQWPVGPLTVGPPNIRKYFTKKIKFTSLKNNISRPMGRFSKSVRIKLTSSGHYPVGPILYNTT